MNILFSGISETNYSIILENNFITRVANDSGIFEQKGCLLTYLNSISITSYSIVLEDDFIIRVEADGGTFEGYDCLTTQIQTLL